MATAASKTVFQELTAAEARAIDGAGHTSREPIAANNGERAAEERQTAEVRACSPP